MKKFLRAGLKALLIVSGVVLVAQFFETALREVLYLVAKLQYSPEMVESWNRVLEAEQAVQATRLGEFASSQPLLFLATGAVAFAYLCEQVSKWLSSLK